MNDPLLVLRRRYRLRYERETPNHSSAGASLGRESDHCTRPLISAGAASNAGHNRACVFPERGQSNCIRVVDIESFIVLVVEIELIDFEISE